MHELPNQGLVVRPEGDSGALAACQVLLILLSLTVSITVTMGSMRADCVCLRDNWRRELGGLFRYRATLGMRVDEKGRAREQRKER